MAPCPTNALAENFNGIHVVVYTDNSGYVSWLSNMGAEDKNGSYHRQNAIQLDGKANVIAREGQIALLSFWTGPSLETGDIHYRLYYIELGTNRVLEASAKTTAEKTKKKEPLQWSAKDPSGSAQSAFNSKGYVASPDSPLAGIFTHSAKVYFRKNGSPDMICAFTSGSAAVPSTTVWAEKVVATGGDF